MSLLFMLLMMAWLCVLVFFFFKQKTAYEMRISDWSSDVCSSDLCRRQPQISDRELRPEPQADGARLCRHLLFAPRRSQDPARGDDGRARAPPPAGQGALCRHFELYARIYAHGSRDPHRLQRAAHHTQSEQFDLQPLNRDTLSHHAHPN